MAKRQRTRELEACNTSKQGRVRGGKRDSDNDRAAMEERYIIIQRVTKEE